MIIKNNGGYNPPKVVKAIKAVKVILLSLLSLLPSSLLSLSLLVLLSDYADYDNYDDYDGYNDYDNDSVMNNCMIMMITTKRDNSVDYSIPDVFTLGDRPVAST